MEFLGSWTSPICSKQLQMSPDIPILCNRCVSQSILLSEEKNLWNQLYSWDFLSLELNFSLLSKLIGAHLPNFAQTPTFGLKIAYLFACLGRRLLPTVRIGSTADHPTPMQVFNFWTKFDYGFLFCATIAQRCPLWCGDCDAAAQKYLDFLSSALRPSNHHNRCSLFVRIWPPWVEDKL